MQQTKTALVQRFGMPSNVKGATQIITTLLPQAALWSAVAWLPALWGGSLWLALPLSAALLAALSLMQLRCFVLMHECGHQSLFRSATLNRGFGFLFGVITGMPQYVWSRHHAFHHATNGNWEQYRGPLNICTTDCYAAMSAQERWRYRALRSLWLAPLGGLVYLLINPRLNWALGCAHWAGHMLHGKLTQPQRSLRDIAASFKTRRWQSRAEFWHMSANNLALFALWAAMSAALGAQWFFGVYVPAVALSGGMGLALFTVQHNFRHAYASATQGWDRDEAALLGTSYLLLPRWLNWCSANIAYHHIHHLSARIANYHLAQSHEAHSRVFASVSRIRLREIPASLQYLLWDVQARRIVSFAQAVKK